MLTSDLTAKLLAQENITIVRAATSTASFDVTSRVLTLPIWKSMTSEIEEMMQCHEVGHALFTDADDWLRSLDSFTAGSKRVFHGYMNVIEDARIEKLMKRRFPGIRKLFFVAYKQLIERDFFKLKGRNVNKLQLIDRINLYFKAGFTLGIKFTEEEKVFVDKVERIETFAEVEAVAHEIYEFSKNKAKQQCSETAEDDIKITIACDDDGDDGDDDTDNGDDQICVDSNGDLIKSDSPNSGAASTQNNADAAADAEIESETDKNLNASLEELADTSVSYQYYDVFTGISHDPIVSYKQILVETAEVDNLIKNDPVARYYGQTHKQDFDNFMLESNRMVNYLVKEFEMRKSAQAYKRAQISKSGSLNMNKIHAYTLTDDIFRRITTIPNGKNHGMVFLMDWSGSMQDVILPTIRQVINLAMFCRRINIPFEVFAFSGSYISRWDTEKQKKNINYVNEVSRDESPFLFSDGRFNLLNLFSSKMTNSEFMTIAYRFTSYFVQNIKGYNLTDTPLNEALLYMLDYIPKYIRQNNIEKMTMITLTDGQGNNLPTSAKHIREVSFNLGKKSKIKNILRDKITQKNYEINTTAQSQTECLLKIIKDRYNISSLGFYICKNSRKTLSMVFEDNLGRHAKESDINCVRDEFRQNGFYSMKGTGRDDLFVIPDTSTKIVDTELVVDAEASAASISRKLSKQLSTKKHSRILLDQFIGYVS